jgi:hypothetical protein
VSSHNRTPETVLNPGERTFEVISVSGHRNRAQRRHEVPFRFREGHPWTGTVFVPKHLQLPARNVPYVKPVEDVTA